MREREALALLASYIDDGHESDMVDLSRALAALRDCAKRRRALARHDPLAEKWARHAARSDAEVLRLRRLARLGGQMAELLNEGHDGGCEDKPCDWCKAAARVLGKWREARRG